MPQQIRTRLGILALGLCLGSLCLDICGCDSSGNSSPATVENKEDLAKREDTIKALYQAKKPASTTNRR